MVSTPASGGQYVLRHGPHEAVIAGVGASVRSLTHDGRDLIVPFGADEIRPAFRGATLAPWPNRIVDGRYTYAGSSHQVPLSEPARGHALHGFALWQRFEPLEHSHERLTLATTIEPQDGYPWRVRIETRFALDSTGLTQMVTATNQSRSTAPFGTGPHPYLVAGPGTVDDWMLELPASQVLRTDDRLAPTQLVDVGSDPSRFDFRSPRLVGDVALDHAFTGVDHAGGLAVVRVVAANGHGAQISFGAECPWVQIHTADSHGRNGLAVEPMTCAPNAFNPAPWATGLIDLGPGASTEAAWTISPVG